MEDSRQTAAHPLQHTIPHTGILPDVDKNGREKSGTADEGKGMESREMEAHHASQPNDLLSKVKLKWNNS